MRIKRIVAIGVTTLFAGLAIGASGVAANATGNNDNHQHQPCTITGHGNNTVLTSTVKVSNDPDSGNHGNWATDNFTRVTTISKSGNAWLVHVVDTGTFTTIPGGVSPESGTPLPNKSFTGSFTGYDNFTVDGKDAPTCDKVPTSINGAPNTSGWPLRFFCNITANCVHQGSWGWTYLINCASLKLEGDTLIRWVNSSDGDTGDITAVLLLKLRLCHVHHTPKPCPSSASPSPSSPSPSPSDTSSASPTPSDSSSASASPSQSDTTSSSPVPVTNVGNTTNTGGSLPVTGTNLGIIFAVGVVLVLGGGGTLFFLRRRATN